MNESGAPGVNGNPIALVILSDIEQGMNNLSAKSEGERADVVLQYGDQTQHLKAGFSLQNEHFLSFNGCFFTRSHKI